MRKNRCSLCGGKLRNNRCTECGLDNTKNDSNYKLNVSSCDREPMTHVHTHTTETYTTPRKPEKQNSRTVRHTYQPAQQPFRSGQKKHRNPLVKIIAVLVIISLATGAGGFISSIREEISGLAEFLDNRGKSDWNYDEIDQEYDPYQYTDKVLSDTGDHFDEVMDPGIYVVGTHIPEGRYDVKLLEGDGSFSVQDNENLIYISEFMQAGEEYAVEEYEDLRLFTGAVLKISSGMHIRMISENAQTGKMTVMENPLKETVEVTYGMVAGEDFEPGFYDVHLNGGENGEWGNFSYLVPGTLSDELMEESDSVTDMIFYNPDIENGKDLVFRNLSIPEGTLLRLQNNTKATLTPSENIATTDYLSFYNILYQEE